MVLKGLNNTNLPKDGIVKPEIYLFTNVILQWLNLLWPTKW